MNKPFKLLRLWTPWKTSFRHALSPKCFSQPDDLRVEYTMLENGLTVATSSRLESPYACIGLYLDAGSRYENTDENGIGHLFQHLVFNRTNEQSSTELDKLITSTGANFKSFTSREMVGYYVQCLKEHIPLAVGILCDCVFNNASSDAEIENVKTKVYHEMLQCDENSNAMLYDYLHSAAFQGTPLEQTVMGPSSNLCSFNTFAMDCFKLKFTEPTRTVLAAVGGLRHIQMAGLAKCHLGHLRLRSLPEGIPYRYTGSDVRYRDDSMPVANVIIAVEGPSWCNEDYIVMEIARHAVGAWDRSQVSGELLPSQVARIASIRNLCDAFKSVYITYKDTALWGAQFISDVTNLDCMTNLVQEEWMYLCNCITQTEVDRAKNFLKTKLLSERQSATNVCHDLGRWTLYKGVQPSITEILKKIDSVKFTDVREVCNHYIYDRCPIVAAMGRVEGLMQYQRIRSGMFWLRC